MWRKARRVRDEPHRVGQPKRVVRTWKGRILTGLLLEDANLIPRFKAGQKVSVSEADLFDFLLRSETRKAGGTTDEILKAQEEQ